MFFEVRGVLQNVLLGVGPVRRQLHRRLGKTGMNGDVSVARARLAAYRRNIDIAHKCILELGPGHTPEVLLLAREAGAARCVGLDVELLTGRKDLREQGVELDLYDGVHMPFEDGTFDVVWSSDVLEHVRRPERTLSESFRVLRPGGTFSAIIDLRDHYFLHIEEKWLHCLGYSDTMWRAISSNRSSFVNRLRASEWATLFARIGFSVLKFERQESELLRRMHREGRIRMGSGTLTEDDAATYRLDVIVTKPT